MAVIAISACSKDEIIKENQEAIAFGDMFVNNATKAIDPSYGVSGGTNQLTKFNVYGTAAINGNTINVYSGEEVTGTVGVGNEWKCTTKTQYWLPGAAYNFAALVDVEKDDLTLSSNLPASFTYDVTSQKDVLYATATATGKQSGNLPVNFDFNHLLSKALFTFTNTDKAANLTVSNIKIEGLSTTGTYTMGATPATGTWTTDNTSFSPIFGGSSVASGKSATSEYERLIIPGTYNLTITFDVTDNKGGQPQNITATLENQKFVGGCVYNFIADIKFGLTYITFTINPTDWVSGGNTNIQG